MSHLGSKAAKVKLKKIGGSLYERWSVWFNPIIHEKSYQSIKKSLKLNLTRFFEEFLMSDEAVSVRSHISQTTKRDARDSTSCL